MAGRERSHRMRGTSRWRAFVSDERGQAATEYILIIGLIVVPLAVAFNALQDVLKSMLMNLARLFSGPGV